jgi:hypothetical protein
MSLACGLVLSACGADTVQQTSAPATLADPPSVRAGLLVLADFPKGWRQDANGTDESEVSKCAPDPGTTTVMGKDFTNDELFASSQADLYTSAEAAVADLAHGRDPAFLECLRQELVDEFVSGINDSSARVVDATLVPVETPASGEERIGLRLTVTVEAPDGVVVVIYDVVLVRVGRVVVSYLFLASTDPFDQALRNTLIDAAVKRVPKL